MKKWLKVFGKTYIRVKLLWERKRLDATDTDWDLSIEIHIHQIFFFFNFIGFYNFTTFLN